MTKRSLGCVKLLAASALLVSFSGCGSSNNDQGTAFTALGWYSVDEEGQCEETGVSAGVHPISSASENSLEYLCFGVRNNLSVAGIRTERAYFEYFVDGASVDIPNTSAAFSSVLGPNPGSETPQSLGGSLPGGFTPEVQIISGLTYMPTEIATFLSLNRARLPEAPFRMTVRTRIAAVTTAGDSLLSNPIDFAIEVTGDNAIPGTGASSELTRDPAAVEAGTEK